MLSVLEIRVVLLDMSNVFDKIWHEGLIYELRQVGIPGEALAFIITFLNNRFLRLIPKRQSFNWLPTKAVVPQGSFLGFLFLLVYINDSWEKTPFAVKLFADDTSLFSAVNDSSISVSELNKDSELVFE